MFRLYAWYPASEPHRSSADFSNIGTPETFVMSNVTNIGYNSEHADVAGVAFMLSATPQTPHHVTISPK